MLAIIGTTVASAVVPSSARSWADSGESAAEGFNVVVDGAPIATVVVGRSPDAETRSAVSLLIDQIEAATGARLEVAEDSTDVDLPLYVGLGSGAPASATGALDGLADDGYVLSPSATSMVIAGPTSRGTRYGVYEFLERFDAVRWLTPGSSGTVVGRFSDLRVSGDPIRDEPAFRHRLLSPLGYGDWADKREPTVWATRNRTRNALSFGHNLHALFSPTVFGDPVNNPAQYRPDFYPIRDGEHFIPPTTQRTNWQPRFSAPGIAEAAADRIIEAFDADPSRTSYSLGVNDSGGFSEDEVDVNRYSALGIYSYSEVYYKFVRDVAEIVHSKYPEHLLGLLAYNSVIDPPTFQLPPNVAPMVTRDRYRWVSPELATTDKALLKRWLAVSQNVGLYDYAYGQFYTAPRIHTAATAAAYRWAADHGVKHFYAELYPLWGEGPKEWVIAKLMWNPSASAERLSIDWARNAVGPRAARHLIEYQRIWENVWTKRVPATSWFRAGQGLVYFYFYEASYLDAVTDTDIIESRKQLEAAEKTAVTDDQKSRAAELLKTFAYFEASALSYPRPPEPPRSPADASRLLATEAARLDPAVQWATRRHEVVAAFAGDPLRSRYTEIKRLLWTGWNCFASWELGRYLHRHEGDRMLLSGLDELEQSSSTNVRTFAKHIRAIAEDRLVRLGENTALESGDLTAWTVDHSDPLREPAEVVLDESSPSGRALLYPGGQRAGGIGQTVTVKPGFFRSDFTVYAEPGDWSGGSVITTWIMRDAAGAVISQLQGRQVALIDAKGRWAHLVHSDVLPENVATIDCICSVLFVSGCSTIRMGCAEFTQLTDERNG